MKTQKIWRKMKNIVGSGLLLCTVGSYGVPEVVGTFLAVGATYKAGGYILSATETSGEVLESSVPGGEGGTPAFTR